MGKLIYTTESMKWFLLFPIFLFFFLFSPASALAAESISQFSSTIVSHENGDFTVTETMTYDFGIASRHGIFRTIPRVSRVGDLYKTINITPVKMLRDGQLESYTETSTNTEVTFKIGSPQRTITGLHTYTLIYTVANGTTTFPDHDELFWNITGNEWEVPIGKVSASMTTDFGVQPTKIACYTGVAGSRDQQCTITDTTVVATQSLAPSEGLSVVASFPKGIFPASILSKEAPVGDSTSEPLNPQVVTAIIFTVISWLVFLNIILPAVLLLWYRAKRTKKRFGPPIVNFDLPEDQAGDRLLPAEAGTIDTAWLDRNDVVATIFDLVIRKYIKIEQKKGKKLLGFGKKQEILIKKLKAYEDTTAFEKTLLDRLFQDGDSIVLNDLGSDFYKTFQELESQIFQRLVKRGFYTKNPKNQRVLLLVGGIFAFVFGGIGLGILLIWLSHLLNGRTQKGNEVDWHIDGLKLFLKQMDRNYKWQAEQLYIVEKMIPYAIALGYIDKFMEQLQIIRPDYHPTWYSGNLAFYAMRSQMFQAMNTSFVTTAPSSSSGFSGGGSSGGGGGGGGGGSW